MRTPMTQSVTSLVDLESRIFAVRGRSVLLDADLAALYGVSTKALLQAVRRNPERFPADFMFHLTNQELAILRSQTVTSSSGSGHGGRRVLPRMPLPNRAWRCSRVSCVAIPR